jgi:SH3-like domain-containing protein
MPLIVLFFSLFLLFFQNVYSNDEYFRTLRNDKVNLRQGPSFDYPIKIFYKKKFLPVLIQERSDNFRKIRDHENNTGWVHISQLSKKKAAIVIDDNSILFNDSTIYSNPVAILKKGRLVKINKCKDNWCKIKTDEFKGWVKKENLWGLL